MDVPHVLVRGEVSRKADDLPYGGAKHDALREDPAVDLAYEWRDGSGTATGTYREVPGDAEVMAVAEELAGDDPRIALIGADSVLHTGHDRAGIASPDGTAHVSLHERTVMTGPAVTYAALVDETREAVPGLAEHRTTLVHVPATGPARGEPVTRYRQDHTLSYDPGELGPVDIHAGMAALGDHTRVPPAMTDLTAYDQSAGEAEVGEVVEEFATGAAGDLFDDFLDRVDRAEGHAPPRR